MLREPPPPLNHLQLLTLPSLHHVNEMVHPVASWLRGSANHHRFHAAVSGWITSAELDGHVTSKIQKTSETSQESIRCHPSPLCYKRHCSCHLASTPKVFPTMGRITTLVCLVSVAPLASALIPLKPPGMRADARFFLDTADTAEWEALLPLGIFHGVTTNPITLDNAGHPCDVFEIHELAMRALDQTNEFICQTWGATAEEMYKNGMDLSGPNRRDIVVAVPVTPAGTEAAAALVQSDVRVCLTATYAARQALIAAGVGADYSCTFLSSLDQAGKDGKKECLKMRDMVENMGSDTRVMVASLRDVDSLCDLAEAGVDTFALSPDIARKLFGEPMTDQAAADFEAAAKRTMSMPKAVY